MPAPPWGKVEQAVISRNTRISIDALTTDGFNDGGALVQLHGDPAPPCCVVRLTRLDKDLVWIDPNRDPDAMAIVKVPTTRPHLCVLSLRCRLRK
jgi:hypothetical protein